MRDLLRIRSFGSDTTATAPEDCPSGQVFNEDDQTCEDAGTVTLPTVNIVGTRGGSSSSSNASSNAPGGTSNAMLFVVAAAVVVGAFYYLFKDSTKYTTNRRRKYRRNAKIHGKKRRVRLPVNKEYAGRYTECACRNCTDTAYSHDGRQNLCTACEDAGCKALGKPWRR